MFLLLTPCRFANYDYDTMFKKNGVIDTTAVDAFKLDARKAFLAGVAAKTNLSVTNAAGALQLARVQVTDIRAGAVIEWYSLALKYTHALLGTCGIPCLCTQPLHVPACAAPPVCCSWKATYKHILQAY
jgi:hypothetical protein